MSRGLARGTLWLACLLLPACGYNPESPPDAKPSVDTSTGGPDSAITVDVIPDLGTAKDTGLPPDGRTTLEVQGSATEVSPPEAGTPAPDTNPEPADTGLATEPDTAVRLDARVFLDVPRIADRPQDVSVALDVPLLPPDTAPPPAPDASVQVDTYVVCPVPSAVPYGQVEYESPIRTGTVATHRCNDGYAPATPVTRTCLADGTWSGQALTCAPVDCGPPPTISNGTRSFTLTTYLQQAQYSCSPDFVMSGVGTLSCQANGTWSGPAPTCARPQYKLTITKSGSGTGTVTGASVGIACGSVCEVTLDAGTLVNLSALAGANQTFIGWESSLCGGPGACGFNISANTAIAAYFSPPPNIMFVTSTAQSPALGGLVQADALCNQRAQAASLAGTYKAWLSSSTASAASRMGSASGWIRPDGKPIFNRLSDIPLNKFFYPPRLDELGQDQGDCLVMTATDSSGGITNSPDASTCADFTSTATPPPTYVTGGYASANSEVFTQTIALNCSDPIRIYCMGVDRTALFLPPQSVAGRYAFTSKTFWKPGNGIASADTVCQTEATQASLPGTYKALLAANGKTAASRFNTTGPAWIRSDGLNLTVTASDFFSASLLEISPNKSADGTQYYGTPGVWGGAASMTTAGTNTTTCFDWLSSVSTDKGLIGEVGITATSIFFGSWSLGCDHTYQLVCLQE